MIAYVTSQGARIIRQGRHLLVRKGDDTHNTLFTYKLDQLLLFGNIEITRNAMLLLFRQGVDTVFFTMNGRYLGRLSQGESKIVHLRKRQFVLLENSEFCLEAAKSIVAGKLANMGTLLWRIKRSRDNPQAGRQAEKIQELLPRLAKAKDIASVRGLEGRGSAIYFEGFPQGFVDSIGFFRRVRRPPTDPVNSVLSLVYTLLMNRVYAAVRAAGLDPYPGVLHSLDYGRYSLVLDLMEEFRTIIADTLTLSLFNLKILQKPDFVIETKIHNQPVDPQEIGAPDNALPDVSKDPLGSMTLDEDADSTFDLPEQRMEESPAQAPAPTGKPAVKLTGQAFGRVLDSFEKKLTTPFHHPVAGRQMTYQDALFFQAAQFRKLIEGELAV
ncbi:MAG: CRISPR-associated endonuclease Cas1, partial [Desulfatibacillaceae bacterium]|nr:CRISPR-associated endonuclease Cas1 [Desulfatibacillaceae bacterium]